MRRPLLLLIAAILLTITFGVGYFGAAYFDQDITDLSARAR
jgi:hypothetical protein